MYVWTIVNNQRETSMSEDLLVFSPCQSWTRHQTMKCLGTNSRIRNTRIYTCLSTGNLPFQWISRLIIHFGAGKRIHFPKRYIVIIHQPESCGHKEGDDFPPLRFGRPVRSWLNLPRYRIYQLYQTLYHIPYPTSFIYIIIMYAIWCINYIIYHISPGTIPAWKIISRSPASRRQQRKGTSMAKGSTSCSTKVKATRGCAVHGFVCGGGEGWYLPGDAKPWVNMQKMKQQLAANCCCPSSPQPVDRWW